MSVVRGVKLRGLFSVWRLSFSLYWKVMDKGIMHLYIYRVVQKSGQPRNSMGVRFFWTTLYIFSMIVKRQCFHGAFGFQKTP